MLTIELHKSLYTIRQRSQINDITEELFSHNQLKQSEISKYFSSFEDSYLSEIPDNIVICCLNFDVDRDDLYISRIEKDKQLVFKLPLKRLSTRQGETDGLDFASANLIFKDIMDENKITTQEAKNCTTSEKKRSWVSQRKTLDKRLKEFLSQIEIGWLGGFKVDITVFDFRVSYLHQSLKGQASKRC